jgi:hypothetical protein
MVACATRQIEDTASHDQQSGFEAALFFASRLRLLDLFWDFDGCRRRGLFHKFAGSGHIGRRRIGGLSHSV